MNCKKCNNQIPDGSIFCNWCGERQIRQRKKKTEIKAPTPRQLKSGAWNIELRREGESVTEATPDLCIAKARAIRAGFIEASKASSRKTLLLKDACTAYIENNKDRLSPSTVQGYESIRDHCFPDLMETNIYSITSDSLRSAVEAECRRKSARGKPYSAKTVHNRYLFLATVLNYYHIEFESPSLPELKRKPIQIIPPEDVYEAVKGTQIELPCLLAMWLTMSISEIRGLTKSKSILNGKITIYETVVDIKGKAVRKEGGKEVERTRVQDIPPYIQSLIDKVDGDVICPLSSQAVNKRLQRRLKKFGYPPLSFHKLRHISASTMAMLNIPANTIQEKGGWKTDYTLKTVYTHTFTPERQRADEELNAHFASIVAEKEEKKEESPPSDSPEIRISTNEFTNAS